MITITPTDVRRACLCPRVFVHGRRSNKPLKIFQGGPILPGIFFHERIMENMFRTILAGKDAFWSDSTLIERVGDETFHAGLWKHLDRNYLTKAVTESDGDMRFSGSQVLAFADAMGKIAEVFTNLVRDAAPMVRTTAEMVDSVFAEPEQNLSREFTTHEGEKVTVSGRYDCLLFNVKKRELIVVDFKCRDQAELIGDIDQLGLYAWMLEKNSAFPISGLIIHVSEHAEVTCLSAEELRAAFGATKRLMEHMAEWISRDAVIPPTSIRSLCAQCPLDPNCDDMFGPRHGSIVQDAAVPPDTTESRDSGILLGRGLTDNAAVRWNPFTGRLTNPHMLVVGTSGSGKTQAVKAIAAELIDRKVPTLIFDFNNDYVSPDFLEAHGIHAYDVLDGLPLNPLELIPDPMDRKISLVKSIFETKGLLSSIFKLGTQQAYKLRAAIEALYLRYGIDENIMTPPETLPPFSELAECITEQPKSGELMGRLDAIFSLRFFAEKKDQPTFQDFITRPTVIRLAPLPTEEVKLAVIDFVLLKLYHTLVGGAHFTIPQRAVIVDEAHKAVHSKTIIKLFREIRKYGVSMILSSQRAHDFHEDIRANAAAKLFLKSTEDKDLKYIRTQLDDDPGEKVANLNKFECFFKDDTHTPYIRLRITPYFERQDHE